MTLLGSGAISRVYLSRFAGENTAFKIFRDEEARKEEHKLLIVIQGSRWQLPSVCKNLVHCFGPANNTPPNPLNHEPPFPIEVYGLHYELAPHGNLADFLRIERPAISEALTFAWAYDLFSALRYLHGVYVHHNDVKPENVLVFANGLLKLGDFNLARHTPNDQPLQSPDVVGTPSYAAPEVLRHENFNYNADVFSAGAVLFQASTGFTWHQLSVELVNHSVEHIAEKLLIKLNSIKLWPPKLLSNSESWYSLLSGVLMLDASRRFSAAEALLNEQVAYFGQHRVRLQLGLDGTLAAQKESELQGALGREVDLQRQLEDRRKHIDTLLGDVVAAKKETDAVKKEQDVLRNEIRSTLVTARADREAKEKAERDKIAALSELRKSEQLQKTNADAYNLPVQRLNGVVTQVTGVIQTPAQVDYDRAVQELAGAEVKRGRLQTHLEATEAQLTETRGKLFTAEQNIEGLRAEIAARDRELADVRTRVRTDEAIASERTALQMTVAGAGTLTLANLQTAMANFAKKLGYKRPRQHPSANAASPRATGAYARPNASGEADDEQEEFQEASTDFHPASPKSPRTQAHVVGSGLVFSICSLYICV